MPTSEEIQKQINKIIGYLVEVGLSSDQNFAFLRQLSSDRIEITFPRAEHVSIAIKDRAYPDLYEHLARERAYSAKMPDGALIQIMCSKVRSRNATGSHFPLPLTLKNSGIIPKFI